jgi:hypothetical protein
LKRRPKTFEPSASYLAMSEAEQEEWQRAMRSRIEETNRRIEESKRRNHENALPYAVNQVVPFGGLMTRASRAAYRKTKARKAASDDEA